MEYVLGELKPCRGASLPLKISDSTSYDDLGGAAIEKRKAFDKRFRPERGYVIAYQDASIAREIPGTNEEFVLKKYKEWLGKPYFRITLYLSPVRSEDEMTESAVDPDHCSDEGSYLGTDDDVGDNTFGEKVDENEVSSSDVIMSTITPYVTTDFM